MPKDTPSIAKNKIKRSLVAIVDPHPSKSDVDALWHYFGSRCAYCGTKIERRSRTGHLDHLIPVSEGGSNNIHNHALSCAHCNGDEKREESWGAFLATKAESPETYERRKLTIEQWLSQLPPKPLSNELWAEADAIIAEAIKSFELSVQKMRSLRDRNAQ